MKNISRRKVIIALIIIFAIAFVAFFAWQGREQANDNEMNQSGNVSEETDSNDSGSSGANDDGNADAPEPETGYENRVPKYDIPKSDDPESLLDPKAPMDSDPVFKNDEEKEKWEKNTKEWAEKWTDDKKVEVLDENGKPTGEYLSGEVSSIPFDKRFASWRYSPGTRDVSRWPSVLFRDEADYDALMFISRFINPSAKSSSWLPYVDDYYLKQDLPEESSRYSKSKLKKLIVVRKGYSDIVYEVKFSNPRKSNGKTERVRFAIKMQGLDPSTWRVTRFVNEMGYF